MVATSGLMQVIGDMPKTPKPTYTHVKFPEGSIVNHCNSGLALNVESNLGKFQQFGGTPK